MLSIYSKASLFQCCLCPSVFTFSCFNKIYGVTDNLIFVIEWAGCNCSEIVFSIYFDKITIVDDRISEFQYERKNTASWGVKVIFIFNQERENFTDAFSTKFCSFYNIKAYSWLNPCFHARWQIFNFRSLNNSDCSFVR